MRVPSAYPCKHGTVLLLLFWSNILAHSAHNTSEQPFVGGCAGQFQCRECDSPAVSAVKYFLLLVALILCNACGVWVYLPEDAGSWAKPEGSDYFEVSVFLLHFLTFSLHFLTALSHCIYFLSLFLR